LRPFIAAVLVMLAAGCGGSSGSTSSTAAASGRDVYESASCGACHTFAPAHSSGKAGPSLDDAHISRAQALRIVRDGNGAMPAFAGQLTEAQITAVVDFVLRGN
jgi:mono/diheme cytochrome c family protein